MFKTAFSNLIYYSEQVVFYTLNVDTFVETASGGEGASRCIFFLRRAPQTVIGGSFEKSWIRSWQYHAKN